MMLLTLMQTATATAVEAVKAVSGASNGDASEVVPYLGAAASLMYTMRWLKTLAWYRQFVQAVPGADKWAHRVVALTGSVAVALGIHVTFVGDYNAGWTVHGVIPSVWNMLHGLGDVGKVYIFQQLSYEMTRRPEGMPHEAVLTGTGDGTTPVKP